MSAVTISLATGIMVFTPGPDGFVPGWLFLMFFRFFVGIGNAGIFTIDLPLVQEFMPAYKRGWVSALITTLLPAGSMLAGIIAASLLPVIGWRGLFLIGLSPLVLVFMIRFWVPESPRWLLRGVGRRAVGGCDGARFPRRGFEQRPERSVGPNLADGPARQRGQRGHRRQTRGLLPEDGRLRRLDPGLDSRRLEHARDPVEA